MISLCLYQMVVSPVKLSALRYFKFVCELASVVMQYFVICDCSESINECHALMRRALLSSHWHAWTSETRRDAVMLVRRVQRPIFLKFYNGAFVLNRIFFLKVIRVSYSFVNFMRLNHH